METIFEITLQQTRVYQDAKAEGELIGEARGELIGEAKVIMRQLNRQMGSVPDLVSA